MSLSGIEGSYLGPPFQIARQGGDGNYLFILFNTRNGSVVNKQHHSSKFPPLSMIDLRTSLNHQYDDI